MPLFVIGLVTFCLTARSSLGADPFLGKQTVSNASLVDSLELLLGPNSLRSRVDTLQDRLKPLFLSLPKNNNDRLSHAAARYALHRTMSDLHGWSVDGLEPNATTYNTTSLVGSGMLRGVVPEHIEYIFEGAVGADGFSLYDLAVLAGTLEYHVHDHQHFILRRVCELFDWPTVGAMEEQHMKELILMYKAVFLIGGGDNEVDMYKFTAAAARQMLNDAPKKYPGWEDTVTFIDDEIESLAFNSREQTNPFHARETSFDMAARVVEQAADHFAHHVAELECQEIKEDLIAFELGDTGRIRLADFYRASLTSRFYYVETTNYLRAIGALDESDFFQGPRVIVSNYVLSNVNCLAHSNTYSICCLNECDHLLGRLEDGAVGIKATPQRIASLVESLSSSTVQAPRNLSQSLVQRLDDIGSKHSGSIMLHSRLFTQFMHHAFPRECPYPHLMGTITSLSPMEWARQNGLSYRIDNKPGQRMSALNTSIQSLELEFAAKQDSLQADASDELMWTFDEETFVLPAQSWPKCIIASASRWSASIGVLATCVGLVYGLRTKASAFNPAVKDSKRDSMFV